MNYTEEILSELCSTLALFNTFRDNAMIDALEYFRCNSRDLACYSDGKLQAYEAIAARLESIIETYGEAGAGATS